MNSQNFLNKIISLCRAALLTLLVSQGAQAQSGDYLGIMGPIGFLDEEWHLASASAQTDDYSRQAYLPSGDSFPNYKRMFVIETVKGGPNVDEALAFQIATLEQRRETDALVNMDVIENKTTGEALIDFVLSGQTEDGVLIVEWNAYRYAPHRFADGRNGIVLYGVSLRAYGDDEARTMLISLKGERSRMVATLAAADLPHPTN